MRMIKVVAAIIRDGDRVFATQRGYGDWKDYWEFPGGKIEPGEGPEEALVREIREELGMDAEEPRFLGSHWYAPSETLMLHYSVTVPEDEPSPNWEVDDWEWVPIGEARSRLAPDGLAEQLLDDYLETR